MLGGIEEESRKCFLVAVEKRDEDTLLPIIQDWIEPGTIIVSGATSEYPATHLHVIE